MKEKSYSPYGNYGLEKINSPKGENKNEPKAKKISGKGDLRCSKKK